MSRSLPLLGRGSTCGLRPREAGARPEATQRGHQARPPTWGCPSCPGPQGLCSHPRRPGCPGPPLSGLKCPLPPPQALVPVWTSTRPHTPAYAVCTHGYPSSPHARPVPRPSGATRPPAHPSGLSATSGRAPGALSWTVEGWPSLPILTGGKALPAPHRGWGVGSRLRGPGRQVRKGCHGGQVQPEVSSCGQGKDCLQGTKCWEPNQRTPPVSLSTSCWDAHAPGPRVIVTFRGPGSLSAHSTHIYLVPIMCQGLFLEPGSEALPSGRLVWGQMCDLSSGHPSREVCPGSYGSLEKGCIPPEPAGWGGDRPGWTGCRGHRSQGHRGEWGGVSSGHSGRAWAWELWALSRRWAWEMGELGGGLWGPGEDPAWRRGHHEIQGEGRRQPRAKAG